MFRENIAVRIQNDALNFLKIRLAYGKTGNDANPYLTGLPYYRKEEIDQGFGSITFPINDYIGYSRTTRMPSTTLRPEISTETEVGFDVRMFRNRIGLDAEFKTDVLSVKVDSNPGALTFAASASVAAVPPPMVYNIIKGASAESLSAMAGWKATINGARVILDGWETASSTAEKKFYTDKIEFTLELDNPINGVNKFKVIGNRYTGWEKDYEYITEFIDNY